MRYPWLVSDLDGTLLNHDKQIAAQNKQALAEFRRQGGRVVLATGRTEPAVANYVVELGITEPCILYNGARVVDMATREVLWEQRLAPEAGAALLGQAATWEPDLHPVFFTGSGAWVQHITPTLAEYSRVDGNLPLREAGRLDALAGMSLVKVLVVGEPERLSELDRRVQQAVPAVHTVRSEPIYLEILPPGSNKGEALRWLAGHLGFDLSQVLAIGDNPNDIEMLQAAGLGVAVGNAHPDLKRIAGAVVATGDHGGVAEAVATFCLRQ